MTLCAGPYGNRPPVIKLYGAANMINIPASCPPCRSEPLVAKPCTPYSASPLVLLTAVTALLPVMSVLIVSSPSCNGETAYERAQANALLLQQLDQYQACQHNKKR